MENGGIDAGNGRIKGQVYQALSAGARGVTSINSHGSGKGEGWIGEEIGIFRHKDR